MNALPPALFRRPCVDPDGSVGFAIARCRDLAPRGEGSARVF